MRQRMHGEWVVSKGVVAAIEVTAAIFLVPVAYPLVILGLLSAAYSTERAARAEISARNAYNASLRDRYAMIRSALAARQLVFGRCRVSGPMFFAASYGADNVHLTICVALAAHEVDAIELVYFDDQPVTLDGSGNVLGVRQQDSFSMTTSSATVTVSKTPTSGSVSATARYGDAIVPLTVSGVSGVNVTVTGGRAGQVGQLDVYYQPTPDPYAPNGVTQRSSVFTVTSATQTFTLPSGGIPAPDASGVHVVYQVTSSQADDSASIGGPSLSGYNVTLTGLTVGRKVVIYYQTANGITKARVRKYTGAPGQTADAGMIANFPGTWTSAHKATGVAYLVIELDYDQDAFSGGVPQISAVVRGMKCYDPRTSVTAWTENPALHNRALAMHPLAGNLPATAIDDVAISTAANVCDAAATYTVGGVDYVRALYTSAYAFTVDRKPMDGLTDLCQAMGGGWAFSDGQLRVNAGAYRTPNPGVLDETWLTDDDAVQIQVGSARASLVNTITGSFADQYQDYVSVPLPQVPPATDDTGAPIPNPYAVADGASLPQVIQYSAVAFSGQAQYLSSCLLRRQRQGTIVKLRCNYRAWQEQAFDVRNVSLARFGWANKPFEVLKDSWTADGSFELTLQETDPSIFDMDAGFSATDIASNTNMPVPWGLPPITSLAGVSGDATLLRQADGTVIPQVQVTWDAITDSRVLQGGYIEIRYWRMGDLVDTYQTVKALGTDTQAFLNGVRDGSMYLITARTASVVTQGPWCTQLVVTASGKSVAPSDVTGMAYLLGNGRVHLSWDQNAVNPDYKLTEVRVGASWAAGTKIGTPTAAALDWVQTTAGTYAVWFAHQNYSGVYSATPASLSVVIDSTVNVTIIQSSLLPMVAVFPADYYGNVSSFATGVATMTVTEMPSGTDVSASWTFAKVDSSGVTSSLGGAHGNVLTISAMTMATDTGYTDVTATRTGFPSVTQRFALSKSKSATLPSTLNKTIGSVNVIGTTIGSVQANAAVLLNSSGFIATRHGNNSTTFVDSATHFENAGSFTATYYTQYDVLTPPTSGSLSGTGQRSLVNASTPGNPITLSVTNGSAVAFVVCTIYDSTGANQLASFNVNLSVSSSP